MGPNTTRGTVDSEKFKSVVDALTHQAATIPDRPFIRYPKLDEDDLLYKTLTFSQFHRLTNALAERYRYELNPSLKQNPDVIDHKQSPQVVVGLLAITSVQYALTSFALIKLGLTVFCLSPRNSPFVLHHLMAKTAARALIVGPQFAYRGRKLEEELGIQVIQIQDVDLEANMNSEVKQPVKPILPFYWRWTADVDPLIMQSSGSTGLPKPLYITNNFLMHVGEIRPYLMTKSPTGEPDVLLSMSPLFHTLGMQLTFIFCLMSGDAYAIPFYSTWPPTTQELLRSLESSHATEAILVPSLIAEMAKFLSAKGDNTYEPLRRLKQLTFGGAPLTRNVGDELAQAGVNLVSIYGSTEMGTVMFTPPKERRKSIFNWDSMQIAEHVNYKWVPIDENLKELYILPTSLRNDVGDQPEGCFRTGDLFVESPTGSGLYVYRGRKDNLLVHTNGEKTNPDMMENIIQEHQHIIEHVVIVGADRFCTAALVQLKQEEALKRTPEEIIHDAQAAVLAANKFAPSHSRMLKAMIYILPLNRKLPLTDKGTVQRKKACEEFVQEIERMYQNQLLGEKMENTKTGSGADGQLTVETIQNFLESTVADMLSRPGSSLEISVSLFDLGLDSLTSMELVNNLSNAYGDLPKNIIFEHPSISALSKAVHARLRGSLVAEMEAAKDPMHIQDVESLLNKYLGLIDKQPYEKQISSQAKTPVFREIVVMTGATGSLGSFILKTILTDPHRVSKVYILLRGENPTERLRKSFEERRLDPTILNDSRVEILHINLSDQNLGLSDEVYNRLLADSTSIIHAAWKMNFNLRVADFELDNILGLYHLLLLARGVGRQRKQFHFISSISACLNAKVATIPERIPPRDPTYPLPNGYAQSKFIADHICAHAAEKWGIPMEVYRVGQISGDTRSGAWNTSEHFPMMIAYGAAWMGELPNEERDINWIPVNVAAEAIYDLAFERRNATASIFHMYHIMNPQTITWEDALTMLRQAGLRFQTVSSQEWVRHLKATKENPGNRLASYFEKTLGEGASNSTPPIFETNETCKRSKVISSACPKLTVEYVQLCLNFWKDIGFLDRGF